MNKGTRQTTMHMVGKFTKHLRFSVIIAAFSGALGGVPSRAHALDLDAVKKARSLQAAGKNDEAQKGLEKALEAEKSAENRALLQFALGDLAFRQKRLAEAQTYFQQALESGTRLEDYTRYQLGLILQQKNEGAAARKQFEAVLGSKAPLQLQYEAKQRLAELAVQARDFKGARKHLATLQKSRKFTVEYPEVLFQLVRVERGLGNRAGMCKWARELFTKYPAHPLVDGWTMELGKAKVDGTALGCAVSVQDKQARIKRLQWAGESSRALGELNELKREAPWLGEYTFDTLLANHLIYEGSVDEALKLLVQHYDKQKGNPGYLMQLGKAASRAGENQVAVGAYYKAYKVNPRGGSAKTALFQAAFMSYQFQDYDGATRKFEEFKKMFPRSGLARDSGWHMAWIRYLKGDYQGSYDSFRRLSVSPEKTKRVRRGRRWVRIKVKSEAQSSERIRYWTAMSLLKLGREDEAKSIFQGMARDPGLGYYSLVSWYRLQALGERQAPKPDARQLASVVEPLEVAPLDAVKLARNEEEESEESMAESVEAGGDAAAGDGAEEGVAEGGEEGGEAGEGLPLEEKTLTAQFDDPYMARRFDRARELNAIGRTDLARQELFEIERRARSREDRRKLMQEYQAVDNYNRPSYISEIGFGAERVRSGLKDGRPLWEYAYPRAFERAVTGNARSFGVPVELVWGIMRAESQYRQDVQSPVGAMGLMQLMPFTGRKVADLLEVKGFEVRSLLEPETNIRLGTRYLQRLQDKFSGAVPLVAASYNAGPHRVSSWLRSFGLLDMDEFIEHIPFIETRNYVKKVVRNYQIYTMLYNGSGSRGGRTLSWLVKPVGVKSSDPGRDVW